jgi:hypothetical protein
MWNQSRLELYRLSVRSVTAPPDGGLAISPADPASESIFRTMRQPSSCSLAWLA